MKRVFAAIILLALFVAPSISLAHSGRTDENHGHYDHKTGLYHYHWGN